MKLLILGGTVFLGRHIVDAALARGHDVTLFNRGQHNPDLFPHVGKLVGDRDSNTNALRGHTFDAVIDTSGYRPQQIRSVMDVLDPSLPHYLFISTISVYRRFAPATSYNEHAPLAEGNDGYGALKVQCERLLEAAMPGRVAHVRPGLIVGPHDPTDRFTYWPRRVAQGGDVLAPGRPQRPVQVIDARDLASWCVQLAETRTTGVFNAAGPDTLLTMQMLLDACRVVTGSDARFTWIDDDRLLAAGVAPWTELPLWIPEPDIDAGGMLLADNRRAIAAGLRFRAIEDTIHATHAWDSSEHASVTPSAIRVTPLTSARERQLLDQFTGR
jgi:2'-hydroxyisoflavone reductase